MSEWAYCNNCSHQTQHDSLLDMEEEWNYGSPDDEPPEWWVERHQVLRCLGCKAIHHLVTTRGFAPEGTVRYPPKSSRKRPRWLLKMPFSLMQLFGEVYQALDADSRVLAAIGARTILDRFIVEVVGDVGTFKEKVQALVGRGIATADDGSILTTALDAGSAAAHRGHEPSAEDLDTVFEIMERILHGHYVVAPAAKKLAERIPPRPPKP